MLFSMAACKKKETAVPESSNAPMVEENTEGTEYTDERADEPDEARDEYFVFDSENVLISLTEGGKGQESLVIPKKCTGLDEGVFSGALVKKIVFEGDDDIGDMSGAFFGADNLAEIKLPGGMKKIGDFAFSNCSALEVVTFPEELETIGDYAFSGCSSLQEIVFTGTSLKDIGENAFEYCDIKELILPEGVENVRTYSFYGNKELASVTLPSTIKNIEDGAFDSCTITELHMLGDMQPDSISYLAFGSELDRIKVYIREGSWLDQNRDAWAGLLKNIVFE